MLCGVPHLGLCIDSLFAKNNDNGYLLFWRGRWAFQLSLTSFVDCTQFLSFVAATPFHFHVPHASIEIAQGLTMVQTCLLSMLLLLLLLLIFCLAMTAWQYWH